MEQQPALDNASKNNASKNNASKQAFNYVPSQWDRAHGELPRASMDALINSMKKCVWQNSGLKIKVEREIWTAYSKSFRRTMLVVTLPAGSTPEQRAEADYWINEIAPLYRYADRPSEY